MADPAESTSHGFYLSGPFEIEAKTSAENGWRKEYRTYTTSIGCSGDYREERLCYEIVAKGFSLADFKLEPGNIYFLRGSFFPSSDVDQSDMLFFEASDRALLNNAANFTGDLVDSVGVTGVGIVCAIDSIVEPARAGTRKDPKYEDKPTTIVTVLHSDFHPTTKEPTQFMVQYRIPPTPNLIGTPKILQVGREYQFHGFIKDYDPATLRYVVIASKVSPTNGNKEYSVDANGIKPKNETAKPPGVAGKPMKYVDPCPVQDLALTDFPSGTRYVPRSVNSAFISPVVATDSESATSMPFGPSDFRPSSFRTVSSEHTVPSGSSVSPEKANIEQSPISPLKKRGRAQPKRGGKKTKKQGPMSDELE